jgi:hypothetical protein
MLTVLHTIRGAPLSKGRQKTATFGVLFSSSLTGSLAFFSSNHGVDLFQLLLVFYKAFIWE